MRIWERASSVAPARKIPEGCGDAAQSAMGQGRSIPCSIETQKTSHLSVVGTTADHHHHQQQQSTVSRSLCRPPPRLARVHRVLEAAAVAVGAPPLQELEAHVPVARGGEAAVAAAAAGGPRGEEAAADAAEVPEAALLRLLGALLVGLLGPVGVGADLRGGEGMPRRRRELPAGIFAVLSPVDWAPPSPPLRPVSTIATVLQTPLAARDQNHSARRCPRPTAPCGRTRWPVISSASSRNSAVTGKVLPGMDTTGTCVARSPRSFLEK